MAPEQSRFCFPPEHRLRKKAEFLALQARGKKLYSRHFVLLIEAKAGDSVLGVTITKKVAPHAVDRNRLRRRIRELFRTSTQLFSQSVALLVIARREAADCSSDEVRREIMGALRHNGYLNGSS